MDRKRQLETVTELGEMLPTLREIVAAHRDAADAKTKSEAAANATGKGKGGGKGAKTE